MRSPQGFPAARASRAQAGQARAGHGSSGAGRLRWPGQRFTAPPNRPHTGRQVSIFMENCVTNPAYDVVAIGNAIVDILAPTYDALIAAQAMTQGPIHPQFSPP